MEYALINTIIASVVTAFVFGMVAKKLNLPAIFGYLLAGVAIGPHTPGFVADVSLAKQLAEMLPVIAEIIQGGQQPSVTVITTTLLEVLFKIGGFFAFMFVVGRRFLPWLLVQIAKMRSAELNTLGTLAIALGFASVAYLVFDASLALGAFLAGVMLSESEIGKKSAENTLPLRDAFSVLFFVSVGMLFDPKTLLLQPVAVLMTFFIIVVAKSIAAIAITSWFKQPQSVTYAVAIGLAQIGEFSFILGGLALAKGLLDQELFNLILAGAMLSIVINPFLFRLYDAKFSSRHVK